MGCEGFGSHDNETWVYVVVAVAFLRSSLLAGFPSPTFAKNLIYPLRGYINCVLLELSSSPDAWLFFFLAFLGVL